MAAKYISELTAVTNLEDTDVLVIDDGSHNYKITWGSLKARLKTVSEFTVDNIAGTIKITAADGTEYTVTPHDPTKQNNLTFDAAPTANSTNPVTSGGVYTSLDNKVDKETGKGLSTNDFTTAEKTKLAGIETGAQVNPSASDSAPLMDGTASAGSSSAWARGDHVHPTDTSREEDGLGITGATSGQSIRVKTVDGNGKPTEFEAFTLEDGTVVQNGRLVRQTSNSFTLNGVYDTTTNNSVTVDVPNSYSAADAGKVVSGNALVPQISSSALSNGLYDTTLVNAFEVAVPAGGDELDVILGLKSGPFTNSDVTVLRPTVFMSTQITEANFPNCTSIGLSAFMSCSLLSKISFPECVTISQYAFASASALLEASFPKCETLMGGVFSRCYSLSKISFPLVRNLSGSTFAYCSSLESAEFSLCTSIGIQCFFNCRALSEISFPVCATVGSSAFGSCSTLKSAIFPTCTTIGSYAFSGCSRLSQVSFPNCTSLATSAFRFCSKLERAEFPKVSIVASGAFGNCDILSQAIFPLCTKISTAAFAYCYSLVEVSFPICSVIEVNAFHYCTNLPTVSFQSCTSIGTTAFSRCTKLESVYLMGSTVPTLASSVFDFTPMVNSTYLGRFGSIFVPSSLYASFVVAANWSSISARIVSM